MDSNGTGTAEMKRVVIIDDHPVVRQGIAQIVSQEGGLTVCAEADDARSGLTAIKKHRPHIAIIDISLPGISGIELIKWVRALDFKVAMLVISMHDESIYAQRALKAGAHGYLMKQESPDKIVEAIQQILRGELYVSDPVAKRIIRHAVRDHKEQRSPIEALSDRELDVFRMIGQGMKPKQIAHALCLSVKTVETHQSNIKEKLALTSSAALSEYAVKWMKNAG